MSKRPSSIAVHEAAHAVIAFLLRAKVIRLTYTRGVSGHTMFEFPHKMCPYVNAMITSAGHRAEVMWRGLPITSWPAEDFGVIARETDLSMFGLNLIGEVVEKTLRAHKDMVMAVATILERDGKISAAGFLRIVMPFVSKMGDKSLVVPLKIRGKK